MSKTKLNLVITLLTGLLLTHGVYARDNWSVIEAYVEI